MPPPQALVIAKAKGLDLVEISPTAVPPYVPAAVGGCLFVSTSSRADATNAVAGFS